MAPVRPRQPGEEDDAPDAAGLSAFDALSGDAMPPGGAQPEKIVAPAAAKPAAPVVPTRRPAAPPVVVAPAKPADPVTRPVRPYVPQPANPQRALTQQAIGEALARAKPPEPSAPPAASRLVRRPVVSPAGDPITRRVFPQAAPAPEPVQPSPARLPPNVDGLGDSTPDVRVPLGAVGALDIDDEWFRQDPAGAVPADEPWETESPALSDAGRAQPTGLITPGRAPRTSDNPHTTQELDLRYIVEEADAELAAQRTEPASRPAAFSSDPAVRDRDVTASMPGRPKDREMRVAAAAAISVVAPIGSGAPRMSDVPSRMSMSPSPSSARLDADVLFEDVLGSSPRLDPAPLPAPVTLPVEPEAAPIIDAGLDEDFGPYDDSISRTRGSSRRGIAVALGTAVLIVSGTMAIARYAGTPHTPEKDARTVGLFLAQKADDVAAKFNEFLPSLGTSPSPASFSDVPAEATPETPPFIGNFTVARFSNGTYEFRCTECADFARTSVDQEWIEDNGGFLLRVSLRFRADGKSYGGWLYLSLPEPGQVVELGRLAFHPVKE